MKPFKIKAPAKINLALWILGRRPDGYHEILTLFMKLPLFDEVFITEAEELKVFCKGCPSGKDNIVFKAIQLLGDELGRKFNVEVRISKKIPMGGGLGGGSSDAAAVLKALNRIYDLGLSLQEMQNIGAQLGADIPFFLLESPMAVGRGKGEILEPVEIQPTFHVKLFCPQIHISTAWAYSQASLKKSFTPKSIAESKLQGLLNAFRTKDWQNLRNFVENDFEKVLSSEFPEMKRLIEKVKAEKGAIAAGLSGSGACCFSIFEAHSQMVELVTPCIVPGHSDLTF